VDGWIAAGTLTLGAQDLAEIAAAVDATRAGSGPARPLEADEGQGSWLQRGLDPSSVEGAIARMVLPVK
jgi:hypothetical protein